MLRHSADVRTLGYLVVIAALGVIQWNLPTFQPLLYGLTLFLSVAVAVISHNHNHLSIWKSKPLNLLTSYVISIHYGHPAIGWVPTHNQNHHKFNNREGDLSRSPQFFKNSHLLSFLVYPTITSLKQTKEINRFIKELWHKDRAAWAAAVSEYVVFFGFMAAVLVLDWQKALLFYVLPQQFALFVIQSFNYVQHIECDPDSDWDHSRNFVSRTLNALLFNNGYHTVHHMKPGVHWSQTPALHAEHAHKIHPDLLVKSYWGFLAKTFIAHRPAKPRAEIARAAAA